MNHVRVTVSTDRREADIHPMYDLVTNAPFVETATAIQWNFSGDEFGIMHYVEGDLDAFVDAVEDIPEVLAYDVEPAGDDAFYAYIRDRTTPATRAVFDLFTRRPIVVVPPIVYRSTGVDMSVFGPASDVQFLLDALPDPLDVEVQTVSGMTTLPGVAEPLLSDRQADAIDAAIDVGYYDIPRTGSHEDVADAIDCAPSTAAEHIRKAEAKLVRSAMQH